jgi:hypothetical protein
MIAWCGHGTTTRKEYAMIKQLNFLSLTLVYMMTVLNCTHLNAFFSVRSVSHGTKMLVSKTMLPLALSGRASKRLQSTFYKDWQNNLLKVACCRQTPQFDVEKYINGFCNDYVEFIGEECKCSCAATANKINTVLFPESTAFDSKKLSENIGFRTHRVCDGRTLLHSLPACRTKMLLEHGADVNARDCAGMPLGSRMSLQKYDPDLLALIEKESKKNGHIRYLDHEGDFYYWYRGLTPLMSAIQHKDFYKFEILLAATPPKEIKKNLIDMQIIAGHSRFVTLFNKKISVKREQGEQAAETIDILKPSEFEVRLKQLEK